MAKKTRILILGDELGLAEPLQQALEKAGHEVESVLVPDEAFPVLAQRGADYIFADCMLQGGMNGIDFLVHVRENFKNVKAKYVLMSGVFTDKTFMREAVERTGALAFLEKKANFDFAQAVKLVQAPAEKPGSPGGAPAHGRKLLYQMFAKDKVSNREKRKIIESLEEVSGFDLPFIYSLLVETGSSGYLNIYEGKGSVSGISFSNGDIVNVDVDDEKTFLGEMLIQSGYVLPEDVQATLKERADRRMGFRMIRAGRLSPHALDLVLTEQMNIRLSRTISDQTIRINFAAADVERAGPYIDSERLQDFLHDWIASKISVNWLKGLYIQLASNAIQVVPSFKSDHPALQTGLVKALPGVVPKLTAGTTLTHLLSEPDYSETAVYKCIHFLLTKGLLIFGDKTAFRSEADQLQVLRKISGDIQGKTPFEIIDFLQLDGDPDQDLSHLLGQAPADERGAARKAWNELSKKIQDACRHTADTQARDQIARSSADKTAEAKLQAAKLMEDARKALSFNQFAAALKTLLDAQALQPTIEHLHTLLAWAKLGSLDPAAKSLPLLKEIEFEIVQVPAEERYDAHYSLVLGLFHKAKGDVMGARKHIERALALNSQLMAARRELSAIDAQLKKEKDIFGGMDLKNLVGGLFGRK